MCESAARFRAGLNTVADWQVWIDTGGTFTDCLALDPQGRMRRVKVLSSSALRGIAVEQVGAHGLRIRCDWPIVDGLVCGFEFAVLGAEEGPVRRVVAATADCIELDGPPLNCLPGVAFELRCPHEAPILAAQLVTGAASIRALPPMAMRLGTTRGTNALLERRGVPTALFTTRGFADLTLIGTQARPDLFALKIERAAPLYAEVVEVEERLDARGNVLQALDLAPLAARARDLVERGIETAAVALMHSYIDPVHEEKVAACLRACGFKYVVCSAARAPFIKFLPRVQTAVVDAYIGPVVDDYLRAVETVLSGGSLHVMTSAGGLLPPTAFSAKDSLLSGPAGGVAGAALVGKRSGYERILSFDMGGTSTDVARCDGHFEYVFEHEVGDAHLVAPALAIETVAAGGGSICALRDGRLHVGPESAGAAPGPACYGAGGPLTLTDINVLLGRIDASRFGIPIAVEHADARLHSVREELFAATGQRPEREALLEGFVEIAYERMADAIRRISLQRGYDPADYALVAFGGAGAQHACGVAALLGVETILVPADAGLLSALGIGHAAIERFAERQLLRLLPDVESEIVGLFAELEADALAQLQRESVAGARVRRRMVEMRFVGQDEPLVLDWCDDLETSFIARYRALYGHSPEARAIEVVALRVVAAAQTQREQVSAHASITDRAQAEAQVSLWSDGAWCQAGLYRREALQPGAQLSGPALIFEAHSATFIAAQWGLEVDAFGTLVLRRTAKQTAREQARPEAVRLELFTNGLRSIASEMGTMLQRTALSTNIKERLDFSCALLDCSGALVVNAPHIPVHLGALGLCVRAVVAELELGPGDTAITNHPGYGGSHLPDITLVTPVYTARGEHLGYVASRAHHAEIGGSRPGSMPPTARSLEEEGVLIAPMYLARAGEVQWGAVRSLFADARYPSRAIEDNMADLAAALAANYRGAEELRALAVRYGIDAVPHYMRLLQNEAAAGVQRALLRLGDGVYAARETLDDGAVLAVQIRVAGGSAVVDWTGTAEVHTGNLNATPAIARSALLYVLRLLVDEDLPLNEGMMENVELVLPAGSLLNPNFALPACEAPAVVGGNVETSQRLVSTLLKALALCAGSQGTMNNVLFGNENFGYYETVCGGTGAGPGYAGAAAVHSHMTNTRITDPEIVEHRYPVRVERFAIRRLSGGRGRWCGGDGAVREFVFLQDMDLSILSQNRRAGPYGLAGGSRGQEGRQWVERASGERVHLAAIDGLRVYTGDRLILETPGGGAYGREET